MMPPLAPFSLPKMCQIVVGRVCPGATELSSDELVPVNLIKSKKRVADHGDGAEHVGGALIRRGRRYNGG